MHGLMRGGEQTVIGRTASQSVASRLLYSFNHALQRTAPAKVTLKMNVKSPLPANKRRDNSDLRLGGEARCDRHLARCRIIDYYGIANHIVTTTNPEHVLTLSKEPEYIATLGLTERLWKKSEPRVSKKEHAVLLTPKEDSMLVWYPLPDGGHQEFDAPWATWYQWMMHAMVLMKEEP